MFCAQASVVISDISLDALVDPLISEHPDQTGIYILEKGEESLLARAWLCENARHSIDVQYFIWSTDNIGILAAECLLRAADRGVQVRVIVDDLLIDAANRNLVALAHHPKVEIRIYNPNQSVGTPFVFRLMNMFTDFRGFNQRMHNKTVTVDGKIAITGGRNMADEYFDYDHAYNFRDRDVLLIGAAAPEVANDFETYWNSSFVVPVESLLAFRSAKQTDEKRLAYYKELHAYAQDPENYAPEVRKALIDLPNQFQALIDTLVWDQVDIVSDRPGKNEARWSLKGSGKLTEILIDHIKQAKTSVTIQSPYLVMPEGGVKLFEKLVQNGVKVRISTNSLASTDNLYASSGYIGQRKKLLKAGIEIYEYRPDPEVRHTLIERFEQLEKTAPVFAIHAKSMVIDGETLFVGTFNLDPRSANLNTEVGVIIRNPKLARQVEQQIETDMQQQNSWKAGKKHADRKSPLLRRMQIQFWRLMPVEALL